MPAEAPFDPCRQWLGIDAVDLGDARRVLGVKPDERDPAVVQRAAEARLSLLRTISPGPFERARTGLMTRVEEARDKLLAEIAAAGAAAAPRVERFSMPPPPSSFSGAAPAAARPPVPGAAPAAWPPAGPAAAPPPPPPAVPAPPPVPRSPGGEQIRIRTAVYRKETPVAGIIALMLLLAGAAGGLFYYKMEMDKKRAADRKAEIAKSEAAKADAETPAGPAKPAKRDPVSSMTRVEGKPKTPPGKRDDDDEDRPFAVPPPMETNERPGRPQRGRKGKGDDADGMAAEEMKPARRPEPEPEMKPAPKPPAKPAGPTAEEKAALAKLDEPLRAALAAIRDKDGDKAVSILEDAAKEFRKGPAAERLGRWRQLAQYAKGFFGFREKALAAVKQGDEFDVNNQKVAIVEWDDRKVVYRSAGGNKTVTPDKLPAGIILAIVTTWFDDKPANHLYLGAYHLTKPESDVERARGEFETATAGGADASELVPLLDDPLFQDKAE